MKDGKSRIDIIGQNGNDGEHYPNRVVAKVCGSCDRRRGEYHRPGCIQDPVNTTTTQKRGPEQ